MTTLIRNIPVNAALGTRSLLWLVAFGSLAVLLALLTKIIIDNPAPSQDIRVMNWIVGWDFWGITLLLELVSTVTDKWAGAIYVVVATTFLLSLGKTRVAMVFTGIGLTVGLVAVLGDFTLGELVDRGRPLASSDNHSSAFPSGHVFASTVFFGFVSFLAVYYHLKPKLLLPLLVILGTAVVLVGLFRVHVQAHFPSDVAAGYLLGGLWLMVVIPTFLWIRNTSWMSAWQSKENYPTWPVKIARWQAQ